MEQDEDMVERCSELVGQHFQFDVIANHWKDVLLDHDKTLAGKPENVVHNLFRFWISHGVEPPILASAEELF